MIFQMALISLNHLVSKKLDTNKYETLLINDFLFNSKNFVNNFGIVSNYDLLLKILILIPKIHLHIKIKRL